MSKKLLSVLLAVLVVAMALPIGLVLAEDPTYTITIVDEKMINGFPATDDKDNSPGMSAEDGVKYYAHTGTSNTVEYAEGVDGVKIVGNGGYGAIDFRLKDTSFEGANMLSFYMDATAANGEGADHVFYARPSFNYASSKFDTDVDEDGVKEKHDVARYFASGHSYYFLEDGATEAIKIDVAQNASVWDVSIKLFAGKKGTYFFPEECFADYGSEVTGNVAPNNVVLPDDAWTSFGDEHLTSSANAWVMDKNNYGNANFSLQQFWIPNGDVIIIDDIKYVQGTITENVPAGPVENPNVPSVGSEDETVEGANDGKITGVDATMEYRAEADADYTAITGVEITGLAPGKYYVRYAATAEFLASADAEVVIAAGAPAGGEGGEEEEPVEAPTYNKEVAGENFDAFVPNMNWDPVWGHNFSIYSNNPGGATNANEVAITDGRFTITPNATALDGMRFTTDIYNVGGNWDAKYEAFAFDLDTTGLADNLTLRMKFFGRNYVPFETERGDIVTVQFNVAANDIYYVAEDGTATKASFVSKEDEAVRDYQWDIPNGFKGTVIIPKNAIVPEVAGNSIDDEFTALGFQFEFLNWRAADNGESVSVDNFKYLYNVDPNAAVALNDYTIELEKDSYTYDGTAKTPAVVIKDAEGNVIDASEYVVSYEGNIEIGTALVVITDAEGGNYIVADGMKEFAITPVALGDLTIELEETEYDYDGTAKEPTVVVKDAEGNVVDEYEYVVTYTNNVNAGTATVTITDAEGGIYTVETTTAEFAIKAAANTNTPAANGQGETVQGKADGIITGVDSTMEYRAEGETTYTAITGTELKGLAPGKYYIRYAATENYAASAEFEVVIAAGQPGPEPDMGVHSYVLAALLLMIAAAGVGVISLKKRAIQ